MEKPQEDTTRAHENPSPRQKIVLVVDDNEDFLNLNKTILEMEDYKVFTASSGDDAFAVLSTIDRPDLILLDMQLGDISGPEFLLELETKRADVFENVPVVFLSAMDKAPASNAMGFIRKPVDMDELLKAVHRFIERGTDHGPHKH